MKSSNPVLTRPDTFSRESWPAPTVGELDAMYAAPGRMTVDDVVMRTAMLLGVILATGSAAWMLELPLGVAMIAALAGFAVSMVVIFKKVTSPPLILTYAALEGVFLGTVSSYFDAAYPGIVVQAVLGTAMAFAGMLAAYRSGRIRVTPKLTRMVVGAGLGLLGLMLVNLVAGLFTEGGLGIRDGGPLAILFSLVAIGVACMFLALDFDQVEKAIAAGAPERESWIAAFGLVVTLVWLYMEILRLISYFRD
ncbi:MAG TPA: Bax inhibitor-1/YccA family protein [Mycobacteriales bacterium]|nr:Bax inhibitor-1/YccA family protein [Mycobacteriales bacterium]